jgi:hypothetical protein
MKIIYVILDAGIQGGSRLSVFYFPVTIALFTYVRHKLLTLIDGLSLYAGPKDIILVKTVRSEKNLLTYRCADSIYLNFSSEK